MEPKFKISEVLSTSWKATKDQIWILVGVLVGYTIIVSILALMSLPTAKSISGQIIVNLIALFVGTIFGLGYMKNLFQSLDGIEPQFSAYGTQARKFFTYLITNILYTIIVCIGCIFFIIPGIYLMLRLQFCYAFIVDEDAGIIESLQRSWEITKGEAMPLFLLMLVWFLLILIGCALLGIGIFVAMPLAGIMYCCTFRKLNAHKMAQETETV